MKPSKFHVRGLPASCIWWGLMLSLTTTWLAQAQPTWPYAVQISAVVQVSPPQLRLNWEPDASATSYDLYRKAKTDLAWGAPIASLPGSAVSYTDTNVAVGATYEYQIVKMTPDFYGYGYIYTGINASLIENRGRLVLVVATESVVGLDNELARLQSDLTGDGWVVLRRNVSSNDTPASVRAVITNDYFAYLNDPVSVKAVFLCGHVPVLQSGDLDYDGHEVRPMPADAYYGEMNADWPTNSITSPSYLPSDVDLMVGRVDLADMPGNGALVPWPSEVELLRNYLNKDHQWRHKQIQVQRRALIADRFEVAGGAAYAASGWRNFEPFVGPGSTFVANVSDTASPDQRWIGLVTSGSYLWSYGCGGGQFTSVSELGTHGLYNDVWSTDIVGQDAQAVFVMFFGSWLGAWDQPDDIMRAVLATPTMGLTCCMAGIPHWFLHHMGLGEPIGYSTRVTMNNSTLYMNQINDLTRAIYIALMGDPTLRLDPVAPPSGLSASVVAGGLRLTWTASPDTVVGYYVYRAASAGGPYTRLSGSLATGTSFTDPSPAAGATYMVRAIKLENDFSGSYYNPSQGSFLTGTAAPIVLAGVVKPNGLQLTWNTQPGMVYRLQAEGSLTGSSWTVVNGPFTATGTSASFVDPSVFSSPQRFYRVVSP